MFWLGLLLPVCYVPNYIGASVPAQWVVLSAFLPAFLWSGATSTFGHKLFLGFLVYATLTLAWTTNAYSWVWGMWFAFVWFLAFHAGTVAIDLRGLWKGLALGLSVSTLVAVAQALDIHPVEIADPYRPAGLFYNSALFGILCAVVMVALLCHRLWFYMPPLALGLLLSGSRGGILILALGACARFSPLFAVACLVLAGGTFAAVGDPADSQRLQIWGVVLRHLTLFGHGAGSLVDLHYIVNATKTLIRPEYVHSDALQLVYEFGIGAIPLLLLLVAPLARTDLADWPIAFVLATSALFFFPLYAPLTAFIWLLVAGHMLRDWGVVWSLRPRSRHGLVPWPPHEVAAADHLRRETLPLVPRTTPTEA